MSRFAFILLVNLLLLSFDKSCCFSVGSRSILREVSSSSGTRDYAVELNVTNFDATLRDTPASFAVVEFFAHWCPACRNYKPHYEKVARLFNGPEAVHPGIILMSRVDCAYKIIKLPPHIIEFLHINAHNNWKIQSIGSSTQANSKLCDRFSVNHYPMLFWGHPSKFVGAGWEQNKEKSEIREIDDGRTAERLLNWINKQIGSSYNLDDEKFENEHLQSNISDAEQIARAVYDVEEATVTAFDIILEHKMIKSETRGSLIRFLQLLVAHHPSRRCRKGTAEVLVNFDDLYPSDALSSDNKTEIVNANLKGPVDKIQVCGKEVPRGYWMFCRGSKNDTRGFSCGLWVLLHSLSVRVDDGESQFAFTTICDFIHNFFICEECRQHFYEVCSSVSTTTTFKKTRDFALWLWSSHNKVNERLMKEEASLGTGDPKFPKIIWPPKQLCSSCYDQDDNDDQRSQKEVLHWNQEEVFKFLTNYYGKNLTTILYKNKEEGGAAVVLEDTSSDSTTTSAVVVPVGAALAIALASCAFGALACYWRSQQKNRKPRRSWN